MKKILLLFMVVLAVCLAGCGSSKLTGDKPLSQAEYNKESVTSDDITADLRFNGQVIIAGTYEAKSRDGKKMRLAAVIPGNLLLRTRTPQITIVDNSSKSYVYRNGGVYHIFYNDTY